MITLKTNIELVEFAKKALREDFGYCLGSFGNILTPSFLNSKLNQGYGVGAYNTRHRAYLNKFINKRKTRSFVLNFIYYSIFTTTFSGAIL